MTQIERAELRELLGKATPGEWDYWHRDMMFSQYNSIGFGNFDALIYGDKQRNVGPTMRRSDAALIVATRNALPALLNELDSKEQEIADLKAVNSTLREKLRILRPVELTGDSAQSFALAAENSRLEQEIARLTARCAALSAALKVHAPCDTCTSSDECGRFGMALACTLGGFDASLWEFSESQYAEKEDE